MPRWGQNHAQGGEKSLMGAGVNIRTPLYISLLLSIYQPLYVFIYPSISIYLTIFFQVVSIFSIVLVVVSTLGKLFSLTH